MKLLVTGTTGGIGGAVKKLALSRGHDVTELNRAGFDALAADPRAPLPPGGPFGGVAFCTGMCPVRPLALTSDALFAETIRVNCGLFLALARRLAADRLLAAGCRLAAVSSASASEGWPGGAAYCASKGALSALCRALDAEFAPKGFSVRALEPRWVRTKMFDACAGRMGTDPSHARDPLDFATDVLTELGG